MAIKNKKKEHFLEQIRSIKSRAPRRSSFSSDERRRAPMTISAANEKAAEQASARPSTELSPEELQRQRDITAESRGLVTCRTVELGALVTKGVDWCRQPHEDCDAGIVVGFLDYHGNEVGKIPGERPKLPDPGP